MSPRVAKNADEDLLLRPALEPVHVQKIFNAAEMLLHQPWAAQEALHDLRVAANVVPVLACSGILPRTRADCESGRLGKWVLSNSGHQRPHVQQPWVARLFRQAHQQALHASLASICGYQPDDTSENGT